jgi:fibronectin-binding autotransporter adhesin
MNRIHRVIWSHARRAWIVASELATGRGKYGRVGRHAVAESAAGANALEASTPKPLSRLRFAMLLALALNGPARAADLYWDINGNTAGLGGSGTWNLANLFWNSSSTGTGGTLTAWDNAALNDAFFSGTAGAITLGAPITVNDLRFLSFGYTLTGNTLTLAGATPTIYMAQSTSINSTLAGTSGVTFNGQGSTNNYLFLGGTNTITGGITLTNGAYLVATGSNALNGANNVVTINSGTILRADHTNAFGGDTAASRLVLSGGQFRLLNGINVTHDLTLTGGTGSLVFEEGGRAPCEWPATCRTPAPMSCRW